MAPDDAFRVLSSNSRKQFVDGARRKRRANLPCTGHLCSSSTVHTSCCFTLAYTSEAAAQRFGYFSSTRLDRPTSL